LVKLLIQKSNWIKNKNIIVYKLSKQIYLIKQLFGQKKKTKKKKQKKNLTIYANNIIIIINITFSSFAVIKVVEPCSHAVQWKGMCSLCGKDCSMYL